MSEPIAVSTDKVTTNDKVEDLEKVNTSGTSAGNTSDDTTDKVKSISTGSTPAASTTTAATAGEVADTLKVLHSGFLTKHPQTGSTSLSALRYQARFFVLTESFFGYTSKKISKIQSEKDLATHWKTSEILFVDQDGKDHIKITFNSVEEDKKSLILKGSVKSVELWVATFRNAGYQQSPPVPAASATATTATTESAPPTSPTMGKSKGSSFGRVFSGKSQAPTTTTTTTTTPATENTETIAPATDASVTATATTDEAQKKSTTTNPFQKAANWFTTSLKLPTKSKPKETTPPVSPITGSASENPVVDNAPVALESDPLNNTTQTNKDDGDQLAIGDANKTNGSTIPDWPMATPVEREVEEPRHSRCANFFGGIFSFCLKESE